MVRIVGLAEGVCDVNGKNVCQFQNGNRGFQARSVCSDCSAEEPVLGGGVPKISVFVGFTGPRPIRTTIGSDKWPALTLSGIAGHDFFAQHLMIDCFPRSN